MGRATSKTIKTFVHHRLLPIHGERFTASFVDNKAQVNELVSLNSKKLRNVIAGYATRLKRRQLTEARR